jgi:glutathione S-transferase
MFFAAGPIEAAVTNKTMGFEIKPEAERMAGYGSMNAVLNAMETAITPGPYILGDQFSAADVYFGSQIGWGLQFGSIERRPAFEAYSNRLRERPAAKRAVEIDGGLIQAEPAAST